MTTVSTTLLVCGRNQGDANSQDKVSYVALAATSSWYDHVVFGLVLLLLMLELLLLLLLLLCVLSLLLLLLVVVGTLVVCC